MLRECIDIFNKKYEEHLEKGNDLILDNYKLDLGYYYLVKKDNSLEKYKIEKENNISKEIYRYLVERDYMSKILETNKGLDLPDKKIHSNNYLTFFIKTDILLKKKIEEIDKCIEKYFKTLKNPEKKYDAFLYKVVEETSGQLNKAEVEKNYSWIKEHIFIIRDELMKKNDSNKNNEYVKIFFEENIEKYKKESDRYLFPSIYIKNDYNNFIYDEVLGIPNDNFNMNVDKPSLEQKTRKKNWTGACFLNIKEALERKRFFDYLEVVYKKEKRNIYFAKDKIITLKEKEILNEDFNGYYINLGIETEKKEVTIKKFEVIPKYEKEISPQIIYLDYLHSNKQNNNYGTVINSISQLGEMINTLFFNGELYKIINEEYNKSQLNNEKEIFYKLLYKSDKNEFYKKYEQIFSKKIIKDLREKNKNFAIERFNFMLSIEESIRKGGENIMDKYEQIRNKFENIFEKGYGSIDNDEEYYFAVGQLIDYYGYLDKKTIKTHDFINPILRIKNPKMLDKKLEDFLKKYSYAMKRIDEKKENKKRAKAEILIEMINKYDFKNSKIDTKAITGGYFSDTLIYAKKQEVTDAENE